MHYYAGLCLLFVMQLSSPNYKVIYDFLHKPCAHLYPSSSTMSHNFVVYSHDKQMITAPECMLKRWHLLHAYLNVK